ncbi:MAG: molecular chaperone Tir [[Candidatus Thermochlorobacteriaceae] bacterium GBChlB]|nr:MAG: molecular chaperone Tir [[Candidatus Thermochlorobacteriaceae] bacterium GBChlB]
MAAHFDKVKNYLLDMDLKIVKEDEAAELVVVEDEEYGIKNLVVDCENPIVILEQLIMPVANESMELYKRLLQMNRTLVHGAFVLSEDGKNIIFRDTLQLENLDANELQASVEALSLAMAEHSAELLKFAKN